MTDTGVDRRQEALQTAFGLFLRFGYRKTSMDEIAHAVGLSRQGLYLWFPSKQALFSEMVDHMMTRSAHAIEAALQAPGASAVERIVDAFDAYMGGVMIPDRDPAALDELLQGSIRILGDRAAAFDARFRSLLVGVLTPYSDAALSAEDLAQVIYLAAAGAKHQVDSREAYLDVVRTAAAVACRQR